LTERVVALISDYDLASRMGRAALEFARREFGLSRMVQETLRAYREAGWNDSSLDRVAGGDTPPTD
jgi:glycosyltransferase involved in cell wall biosynthesis